MSAPRYIDNDGGFWGRSRSGRWLCDQGHAHPGRQHAVRCNARARLYRLYLESGMPKTEAARLARSRTR